jgi:SAM-dependent methyltransferase
MTDSELRLRAYRYFPYERQLAEREVHALTGRPPAVHASGHMTVGGVIAPGQARRFTYFDEVVLPRGKRVVPLQTLLETSGDAGQARQQTRYSAHGIHDYKGKFNPQIVRAIANVLSLRGGDLVFDPFCGSGTVLLESLHDGRSAIGIDMNPLAVAIANAKIAALRARPQTLERATEMFAVHIDEYRRLQTPSLENKDIDRLCGPAWLLRLPNERYLAAWFPHAVLAQIVVCLDAIERAVPRNLRGLFTMFLSHVLRECSWQDPADLRIRRRKDCSDNYALIDAVQRHARQQYQKIAAARAHVGAPRGAQQAHGADGRLPLPQPVARQLAGGVAAIITSPPYATALPYADTQRLSLALLLPEHRVRELDCELLGSRELTKTARAREEEALRAGSQRLPSEITTLCTRILDSLDPARDGFRKANTAALLHRYFVGMRSVLQSSYSVLRRGGHMALVVGPNQTVCGGERFVIDTPDLLAQLGLRVGFEIQEVMPLQAYQRFSMHAENSIREERLIILRKR